MRGVLYEWPFIYNVAQDTSVTDASGANVGAGACGATRRPSAGHALALARAGVRGGLALGPRGGAVPPGAARRGQGSSRPRDPRGSGAGARAAGGPRPRAAPGLPGHFGAVARWSSAGTEAA